MDGPIHAKIHGQIDGQTEECADGQMKQTCADGWTGGRMD